MDCLFGRVGTRHCSRGRKEHGGRVESRAILRTVSCVARALTALGVHLIRGLGEAVLVGGQHDANALGYQRQWCGVLLARQFE